MFLTSLYQRCFHSRFIRIWLLGLIICTTCLWWVGRQQTGAAQGISTFVSVSAASFAQHRIVAPGSIAAGFGVGMTPGAIFLGTDINPDPSVIELPEILGGLTVEVHGRAAQLLFVSPGQINYIVPPDLKKGVGPIVVRKISGETVAVGEIEIDDVAPGIFTSDSNGQGLPAAQIVRVRTNGSLSFEQVSSTHPIDLGPEGEQVFLVLYLTGVEQITNMAHTRILLGGAEYTPDFIGPAPGFIGLEQVNFRLPRTLHGKLSLAFKALGFIASQVLEIEIAEPSLPPSSLPKPSILGMNRTEMQAGDSVEITGSNFRSDAEVIFFDAERHAYNAKVIESSDSSLRVLVPFGAGSGTVTVRTEAGETSRPVTFRTSMSGIIQQAERQANGSYRRIGVPNLTLRVPTVSGEIRTTTNADGAFLMAGVPQSNAALFYVDGNVNGLLPGFNVPYKMPIRAGRDNQYPGYIEVKSAGEAASGQTIAVDGHGRLPETPIGIPGGSVIVEPQGSRLESAAGEPGQNVTVTVLDPGRVPANLPPDHFSSTIVQITPTGTRIDPGMKLTFQNNDNLPAGSEVSLFQYEVRSDNENIGKFVEIDKARVSADGQQVETPDNAIRVASYYFVSIRRATIDLYGSVIEEDGRPARGALVQVRGQSVLTETDDNGAYILPRVPFLNGVDLVIEVSFLRPDGTVDRVERVVKELRPNDLRFVSPSIVLPGSGRSRAPALLAPQRLTIIAGRTTEFPFLAYPQSRNATLGPVTVAGAAFASVESQAGDSYLLRLSPAANAAGAYVLQLTAVDSLDQSTMLSITVEVKAESPAPTAVSRSITTNEDTPVNISLTGSGGSVYRIVQPPRWGMLSGSLPNPTYTPAMHFNGVDRFSYTVGNGSAESSPAEVTIAVRPINDAPILSGQDVYRVNIGERLVVVINGVDVDAGQNLTLEASTLPEGALAPQQETATGYIIEWRPRFNQIGTYRITVTLRDDGTPPLSATRVITIIVDAKWALSPGIEGGFIFTLAGSGQTVFAGSYGSGVFRSTDGGTTWSTANHGLTNLNIWELKMSGQALYAGTDGGGVFRSTDNGNTWTAINNGLTNLEIRSLMVEGGAVYAGTRIGGIFRSTDNGVTWVNLIRINAEVRALLLVDDEIYAGTLGAGVVISPDDGVSWFSLNNGLGNLSIRALAENGEMIFAGTGSGVFRLPIGSGFWNTANNGLNDGNVRSLATSGRTVFVGTLSGGVSRSTNNGSSWTQVNSGLPNFQIISLATTESQLFAGTYGGGVVRFPLNGTTWSTVNNGLSARFVYSVVLNNQLGFAASYGGGMFRLSDLGGIWVPANNGLANPDVTALIASGQTLYAGTYGGGVFRSTNDGGNWSSFSSGLPSNADPNQPVPFAQILTFAQSGQSLFAGTLGRGVYRTGLNTASWSSSGTGLSTRTVVALAADSQATYAGVDAGGVYRLLSGGSQWIPISNGLTNNNVSSLALHEGALYVGTVGGVFLSTNQGNSFVAINNGLTDRQVSALAAGNGVLVAGTLSGKVFRSADGGNSWINLSTGLNGSPVLWLTVNGSTIFAGTMGGVYILAESAQVWSEDNTGLSNPFINTALTNGEDLLVGTYNGGVYRSMNEGRNWESSSPGLPIAADVRGLVSNGAGVFAGVLGAGVYFSDDGGRNWAARNNGLSNLQVNSLATNGAVLWAGTNGGVFRSTNQGINWTQTNTGLTQLRVLSLIINGAGLFAGTDNGLFKSADGGANWSSANTGLQSLHIQSLGVAADGATLLAGTINGLHRSTNQGQSWSRVNNGIPEQIVVLSFAAAGTKSLAGTVYGFYLSEDNGASWRVSNTGLLNPQVSALATKGNLIVAGTRSGGVFTTRLE